MVKTKEGSRAMEGLKTASNAVTKATDALVKAAQRVVKKPATPTVKVDRFKQVGLLRSCSGLDIFMIFPYYRELRQRLES